MRITRKLSRMVSLRRLVNNLEKAKTVSERTKKTDGFLFFWSSYTIWFVFMSFHFYYLIIRLGNNGLINIKELMNVFKIKVIMDYLWIAIFPFSIKISYYFSIRKTILNKPFTEKEKSEVKLAFKTLGILFIIALIFTIIFN